MFSGKTLDLLKDLTLVLKRLIFPPRHSLLQMMKYHHILDSYNFLVNKKDFSVLYCEVLFFQDLDLHALHVVQNVYLR